MLRRVKIAVGLSLLLFAGDALAWGLQTHVFLGQYALLAAPLADPDFRRAVCRMPLLVLAGACLPDLSLVGRLLGTAAFRRTHQWASLRRLAAATCDEERALAVGYASHLLADTIAHNDFVPEHEQRIAELPYVTHALCEWAMDHHVKELAWARPGELLVAERQPAAVAVARAFRCEEATAGRAIDLLARADRVLRASPLPRWSRGLARSFDRELPARFESYLDRTAARLAQLDALLEGAEPRHQAEPDSGDLERLRDEERLRSGPQLI